jgi:hypothetical protein
VHSVIISVDKWAHIQSGRQFDIPGQGIIVKGMPAQDFWCFNKEKPRDLLI